ncbi:Gustatory receptor for sugar taste 43a [Frankliniella fusca]|uniref:Gustatory receptor n=1 Tax=Frankliniella fusca TaxID=407009 RepID=A0AAE1H9G8_9NEOP|nr:Gustatory receptor for sugar taste 43a [Frankliniella fusca]
MWQWARLFGQAPFALGRGASWACRCAGPVAGARARTLGALIDVRPAVQVPGGAGGPDRRCACAPPLPRPSRPWEAYSLAIVLLCAPATVAVLYNFHRQTAEDTNPRVFTKTDRVVTQLDVILVMLSGNVAVLQALLYRRQSHVFMEQQSTVDRLLQARPPGVQLYLLLWLSAVSLLSALDILYVYATGGPFVALCHVPNQANYLLIYTMEALFAEDVHCIFRRFKTLNDRLKSSCLAAARRFPLELRPGLTLVAETPWKFGTADPSWPSSSGTGTGSGSGGGRSGRTRRAQELDGVPVHQLEDAHALLCSSALNVVSRYGPVLLIDVLNLLMHFVTTSYFFLSVLVLDVKLQWYHFESYVTLQSLWMLAHLSRLVLLVLPCSCVKEEANKTGALVGTFLNTLHPSSYSRRQLEMFSMQLMHQRVTFSPCGLFELDLSLVVTLLGAVTTYLVVLMQIKVPPSSDIYLNTTNRSD